MSGIATGKLETVVTYLEMTAAPKAPPPPLPLCRIALMRAEPITVSFYRYLYDTIGERYLWWERRAWSNEKLNRHLAEDGVDVFVLYGGGVPAGYFELDARDAKNIELAYFGLIPDFVGRGFGRYLLRAAIDEAWLRNPARLWVHTCNLDHPAALALYQQQGFTAYDQKRKIIDDPRLTGLFSKQSGQSPA
ncbi:MAG: GNAT family N-acetyltransferase [Proteobacteria bacterium]|nr:GNAT family N-acetyltransferase [Pseudomonadota bacterium]